MQALDTFLFEDLHAWNVYSSSRAGCSCTLGSRLELSQVACQLFTQCDLHVHDQHDTYGFRLLKYLYYVAVITSSLCQGRVTKYLGGRHTMLRTGSSAHSCMKCQVICEAAVSMMGSPLCQRALPPFPPAWPCALLVAPPILVVAALACSMHGLS